MHFFSGVLTVSYTLTKEKCLSLCLAADLEVIDCVVTAPNPPGRLGTVCASFLLIGCPALSSPPMSVCQVWSTACPPPGLFPYRASFHNKCCLAPLPGLCFSGY